MYPITSNKSLKIQILRGLAIIAVVLIHACPSGITQVLCRPFINFSVGSFLFLSGMLSNVERWNPKKRIMKVVIPYVIWTLIYTIISNIKSLASIPLVYIRNLIIAGAAAMMYYVFVYCEFTLLIPIIDKLAKSKYRWFGFVISPLEIAAMRLIPLLADYKVNKYVELIMHISCLGWFTYYYLGFLLGNGYLKINLSTFKIYAIWIITVILQIGEGFLYYSLGDQNCGTQLKLSAILAGVFFVLLGYRYLDDERNVLAPKLLHVLGDNSFGLFFSHLAVMTVLSQLPYYNTIAIFPINAVITILVSLLFIRLGKLVLGQYSKYLAL